jgi:hypothetical protein
MFALGLALGLMVAVLGFGVAWLILWHMDVPEATAYSARATIRDIERQTIHAMLTAELPAERVADEADRYMDARP